MFTDDVDNRDHPYDEPVRGRDEVVKSWLGEGEHAGASTRDPDGTFDATYRAIAVDGDVVVASGNRRGNAVAGGRAGMTALEKLLEDAERPGLHPPCD